MCIPFVYGCIDSSFANSKNSKIKNKNENGEYKNEKCKQKQDPLRDSLRDPFKGILEESLRTP